MSISSERSAPPQDPIVDGRTLSNEVPAELAAKPQVAGEGLRGALLEEIVKHGRSRAEAAQGGRREGGQQVKTRNVLVRQNLVGICQEND